MLLASLRAAFCQVLKHSLAFLEPDHGDLLWTRPHASRTNFGWMRKLWPRKPGAWLKVASSISSKEGT